MVFSFDISFSPRVALGTSIALTAAIMLTLFYSLWQWHGDWQLTHRPLPTETVVKTKGPATEFIMDIPEEHLFGQSLAKLGEMPISDLQLQVTGIIKIEDGQTKDRSKALISVSQQPSKIYQAGDHLPYGVKVYEITKEAVLIEHEGHVEKLPLLRKPLQFKANIPKTTAFTEEDVRHEQDHD